MPRKRLKSKIENNNSNAPIYQDAQTSPIKEIEFADPMSQRSKKRSIVEQLVSEQPSLAVSKKRGNYSDVSMADV